jgi:hypothetical protein
MNVLLMYYRFVCLIGVHVGFSYLVLMFRLCVWHMNVCVVFVLVFPWPDPEYKFVLALGVCSRLYIGICLFMFNECFYYLVWRVCDVCTNDCVGF